MEGDCEEVLRRGLLVVWRKGGSIGGCDLLGRLIGAAGGGT